MKFIIPDIKFPIREEYHLILLPKPNGENLVFKAILPFDVMIEFYEDGSKKYIPLYHWQNLLIKFFKVLINIKTGLRLRYLRKRNKDTYFKRGK